MRKILACVMVLLIATPCLASPWSKAFPVGENVKGLSGWSVRVDKLGSWMETYAVKIKWDKLLPTLGTWDINGEPKNLLSVSPTKIVITESWGIEPGQREMEINARKRLADITVVSRMKEDVYGLGGYIQHVEGLEIPFAVLWDHDATKARLLMGEKIWEEQEEQDSQQ